MTKQISRNAKLQTPNPLTENVYLAPFFVPNEGKNTNFKNLTKIKRGSTSRSETFGTGIWGL